MVNCCEISLRLAGLTIVQMIPWHLWWNGWSFVTSVSLADMVLAKIGKFSTVMSVRLLPCGY